MLQHFSFKSMYENSQLPGWTIAFYFNNKRYTADYMPDGTIHWNGDTPPELDNVTKMVHELMTFHVYE
ncbi:YheE family protein [Sporosarcina sp. 179-K 3D1 HS]|uniref:YheE family protein n=1 Tax=Sporosarcina sp. 179-K 3D1 HS TaxID=3232169 RepID=UPI0039A15B74